MWSRRYLRAPGRLHQKIRLRAGPSFNAQPAFAAEMGKMLIGKLEQLLGQAVRILFPAGEPSVPLKDA